jgi:hypothetical protein
MLINQMEKELISYNLETFDELGRKLQDIGLITPKRVPKNE